MYNLLVKCYPWDGNPALIREDRIFIHTDPSLIKKLQEAGMESMEDMKSLPTLFVEENTGDHTQIAHIGVIKNILSKNKEGITVDYILDHSFPPIPQWFLRQRAQSFHIESSELAKTHWAIKDIDLFATLFRYLPARRQQPKAFKINDYHWTNKRLIALLMPFSEEFNALSLALKSIGYPLNMECKRADDVWTNPAIIEDIIALIDEARVVLCDCTCRNPNVFYEIGIAHTLGKEVILLTQNPKDIPFDTTHLRHVIYENTPQGHEELTRKLINRITELIETQ